MPRKYKKKKSSKWACYGCKKKFGSAKLVKGHYNRSHR